MTEPARTTPKNRAARSVAVRLAGTRGTDPSANRIRTAGPGDTPAIEVIVTRPPATGRVAQVTGAPAVQPSKQTVSRAKARPSERRQRRAPVDTDVEPIAHGIPSTTPDATG